MKKSIKFLTLGMIAFFSLGFFSCQKESKKEAVLSAPEGVYVALDYQNYGETQYILEWEKVTGATGYTIKIDEEIIDEEVSYEETDYVLLDYIESGKSYSISIKANGNEEISESPFTTVKFLAEETTEDFKYTELEDGTYSVGKHSFSQKFTGRVVFPDYYYGVKVSEIAGQTLFLSRDVNSIRLPKVKRILDDALSGCSITAIVIPEGVEVLGDAAHGTNYKLKSVVLPKSLTEISPYLFTHCQALEQIDIPENVVKIGNHDFLNCGMREIFIPKKVETIERSAFSSASLKKIQVDEGNEHFISIDGNLYSKDGTEMIAYALGKKELTFIFVCAIK